MHNIASPRLNAIWNCSRADQEKPGHISSERSGPGEPGTHHRDIAITRYRGIAISRCRDIAILRYRDIAISRYRDDAIPRHRDIAMSQYRDIAISRWRDTPISGYRDIAISRHRDIAISCYRDNRSVLNRCVPVSPSAREQFQIGFSLGDTMLCILGQLLKHSIW